MADYIKEIPNGSMMIRDLGYDVQFFFKTGSTTWNNQQDWGWSIDGGGFNMGVFKLSTGGAWHHLGTIQVGAGGDRLVGMRIVGEGLGWATTDHMVWVPRATVPPAPTLHSAVAISTTQARVNFGGNGDGGSGILEWQIGYGTDPWNVQYLAGGMTGLDVIGGLNGQWWYFWARGRNALGWGPWSNRGAAHIWRVPDAPTPVTLSQVTQKSLHASFRGGFDGGEGHDEFQLAYGLVNDVAQATHITANSGEVDLTNLQHGRIYHFWARGRNAVGWGPYSAVRVQALIAGSRVNDGGTWKRAVPYVKDGGIWKLAKPYGKAAGAWKEAS